MESAREQQENKKLSGKATWLLLAGLLFGLSLLYWTTRPFPDTLVRRTVSMRALSQAQRLNIQLAAQKLDGIVLRPHERFSFNAVVGPRTATRGFLLAPSYVGRETANTMGGGICLVSSSLYQSALEAGLNVTQRTAHGRTVHTVPAGLDATVWYGRSDLCFENTLDIPIAIKTTYEPYEVTVSLTGQAGPNTRGSQCRLTRCEYFCPGKRLIVEVFRKRGLTSTLVSRDAYVVD